MQPSYKSSIPNFCIAGQVRVTPQVGPHHQANADMSVHQTTYGRPNNFPGQQIPNGHLNNVPGQQSSPNHLNNTPSAQYLASIAFNLGVTTDGLSKAIGIINKRLHAIYSQGATFPVLIAPQLYNPNDFLDLSLMSPAELRRYELPMRIEGSLENDTDIGRLQNLLVGLGGHWTRAYGNTATIRLLAMVGPKQFLQVGSGLIEELVAQQNLPYDAANTVRFRNQNANLKPESAIEYVEFVYRTLEQGGLSKTSCQIAMERLSELHLAELPTF